MSIEEKLNIQEIESLVADAKIVSDDTKLGQHTIQGATKMHPSTTDSKTKSRKFADLDAQQKQNIQLLLDINASVTVELGRTKLTVREILSLGEGSIIELNKSANQPVDLIVNNQYIGQGEVVVIEENFGTRVTKIIRSADRLNKL